ncbi:MAG: hypothetical protein KDJ17_02320, partial [Hyphomicrobiaceae bacterium]|nr:hypothetical protein [Hyphomicrobiaceae bacterium]
LDVGADFLLCELLLLASALNANRARRIGIAVSKEINPVLGLSFAPELEDGGVAKHTPKQDDARPLEFLPVQGLGDF